MSARPNNKARGLKKEASILPHVRTKLDMKQVQTNLEAQAKAGKLAGYLRTGQNKFQLDAFATPFDHDLFGRGQHNDGISTIRFSMVMRRKMPLLFALVLLFTIEPGRYFTHQLIPGTWGWIDTMYWYYPITILPIPFIWPKLLRQSRESALTHAREQIEKIAIACQGRMEEPGG